MASLLNQFKSILENSDFELFNSYSSTRLKQRLVKCYSSEIVLTKYKERNVQISLFTVPPFQFLKSSKLLQL